MEELTVLVAVKQGASLPRYATPASSGMDLCACIQEPVTLEPFGRSLIPTGLFLSIPEGYEAQIRPRSGLAHKFGITVLNTPGTIDSDYRGEVKVILINFGNVPFTIQNGDRIAQMVFAGVTRAGLSAVKVLDDTDRGKGGFGSTGI